MRLSFIEPMLPTLVEVPPEGDNWIHEIKYDGYRTQLILDGKGARAYTRRGADWSAKYAPILDEAANLKYRDAIIDGEMYLPSESGAANFVEFRRAIKGRPKSLVFMAFDILHLNGQDLRRQPLLRCKEALARLIPAKGNIRFSEHVTGGGKAFYEAVDGMGLEGMVSKRPDSEYRSGRTEAWLKTKSFMVSEYEVAAVLAERGKPTMALMVDPECNYVGGAFICQARCPMAGTGRHGHHSALARRRGFAPCQRQRHTGLTPRSRVRCGRQCTLSVPESPIYCSSRMTRLLARSTMRLTAGRHDGPGVGVRRAAGVERPNPAYIGTYELRRWYCESVETKKKAKALLEAEANQISSASAYTSNYQIGNHSRRLSQVTSSPNFEGHPMRRARALASASVVNVLLWTTFGLAYPSAAKPLLTPEAINAAPLDAFPARYGPTATIDPLETSSTFSVDTPPAPTGFSLPESPEKVPSASIARWQILLDRAGASPGVIDGLDGGNVRGAIAAFEAMRGLPVDGEIDERVIASVDAMGQAIGTYVIKAEDLADVVGSIPKDYAEMAEMPFLGYTTAVESLAERFHMDDDFLKHLNPDATFTEGETIFVADLGANIQGEAAWLEVDKAKGQLRAYTADGTLLVAYPATIGSEENPSPSGTHEIKVVVDHPTYTYNPKLNFQQGDNDKVLTLPAGPNGPVGTMWIDLSEPSFGIHGTPEPARIDKTGSHGCVRLTNWDAEELGKLVAAGVPVNFM